MKKVFLISVLFILVSGFFQFSFGQAKGFGAGIILGDPSGLSFKKWTTNRGAVDAGIGWSVYNESFHIHADYLVHFMHAIDINQGQLPLYAGIGASLNAGNPTSFGARIPLGINYIFGDVPLDLFAEIVPGLQLAPDTRFMLEAGVGIRYWFK